LIFATCCHAPLAFSKSRFFAYAISTAVIFFRADIFDIDASFNIVFTLLAMYYFAISSLLSL